MIESSPSNPAPVHLTGREVKDVVQELLKSGFIDSAERPSAFNSVMRLKNEINAALDPLDLTLTLDEVRGLAILRVTESAAEDPDQQWAHPLVRRQRLTIEQSLLVAILRQVYVIQEQESGIGVCLVKLPIEDLLSQLNAFLGDTGSDTKNEQRLFTLIDQLKTHGIVSEPDERREVTIRPLIVYLANPESLTALLLKFRNLAGNSGLLV